MAAYLMLEDLADSSPTDIVCGREGVSTRRHYEVGGIGGVSDLQFVLVQIMGQTSNGPASGQVLRTLPLCDPVYPWLTAASCTLKGVGVPVGSAQLATPAFGGIDATQAQPPPPGPWPLYTQYQASVEFRSRPYTVVAANTLAQQQGSWVNKAGNTQQYTYWPEWLRYTDWTVDPKCEALSCDVSNLVLRTSTPTDGINGVNGQSKPRLYLPDALVRCIWYAVPYRYITSSNSYIAGAATVAGDTSGKGRYWVGCVNQNQFFGFQPGQLLFVSYKYTKYRDVLPATTSSIIGGGLPLTSYNFLCDIEFTFLYTQRRLPGGDSGGAAPANGNFIQNGWNLLPWIGDRTFRYATTTGATGTKVQTPSFYSCPFEMLFADPDVNAEQGSMLVKGLSDWGT